MGRVQRLTDELANQIAAGEVVERPSSVVKELVENALDAKATRVTVDIERGGTVLVRVTDDGEGMSKEDALLAIERHATSKIRTLDDLFRIESFGFRGEALPSIASVSQFMLRTRLHDEHEGVEISVAGGKAPTVRPAGGAAGTSIEVRELFFNVPARRKFLKATGTESAHIADVVVGAALARPDVTFTLSRDGRVVREYLRVGSRAERARSASSGEALVHVVSERGPLRIEAMLAAPERARAGASGLSILVNGRPVRDRVLARSIANAYGSVLEAGRYPVGVVWIELPPALVDINVHPQKAEVRFTDARGIFDALTRELHDGLASAFHLSDVAQPFVNASPSPLATSAPIPLPRFDAPFTAAMPSSTVPSIGSAPNLLSDGNLFVADSRGSNPWSGPGLYANLRFIGQVHGTFLVCEADDGLYVIDQHAAAERVSFDRLRRAFAAREIAMQRLLVPEMVELSAPLVAVLEEQNEEIGALGVEVRAVGDGAVAVHAVPAILSRAKPAEIVRDLASELSRSAGRSFGGAVDLVLATMACHGSIRAGDAVSPEEARSLLSALDGVDFAGHCPHGRPVVMRLGWSELERRVGR